MRKTPVKRKLAVLCASALLGFACAGGYYAYALGNMTDWQRGREIDFDKQTGSTKFLALVRAANVGGIAFCASAILIYKFSKE